MADRIELLVDEIPTLRAPVLLAGFAGWGDGALAGSGALQYLIGKYEGRRIATYESDDIYDYSSSRPVTALGEDGERSLIWPSLALYACPLPDADRDLLILMGPEPNLRWRALAQSIVEVAGRFGVADVLVLGSYWDRVTHLGRALLSGRANDAALGEQMLALGVPESRYQGPTGFSSALLDACRGADLRAGSLSGRAPHYVQGITQPKLAHALLRAAAKLTGLRFELADLEAAGREQEQRITEKVQEDAKLWRYVQRVAAEAGQTAALDDLGSASWQTIASSAPSEEAPDPSRTPAGRADLPSGKDLVDAVEAFLRGDNN